MSDIDLKEGWDRDAHDKKYLGHDEYNDGYTHEALHTAHVLCDTWDQHVTDTRCCAEFPDVKAAAEKAAQAMYDLYQLIGQKFRN